MTEEEKKEFEEFLKWKAEKAKQAEQAEQEQQIDEPVEVVDNSSQQKSAPQDTTISNGDPEKESSNKGFIILGSAIIAIVVIFIIVGISGNKQSVPPEEFVAEEDSVEVVVAEPFDESVSEPAKAEWDFLIDKDEMTDSKNIWANISSDNYVIQDFPYEGQTRATITVRYMKKYGYDVLIQISQGQFNGREYYGTNYVTARFNEESPKKYYFNESADGDSKIVFLRKSADFIKNCKKATDIKIDLPLYKGGRPVFTFHVDEPLVWREE